MTSSTRDCFVPSVIVFSAETAAVLSHTTCFFDTFLYPGNREQGVSACYAAGLTLDTSLGPQSRIRTPHVCGRHGPSAVGALPRHTQTKMKLLLFQG